MTAQEEFETLKCDYIQKAQIHLKELQALKMDDFRQITSAVDVVLTQNAVSLSFLSLSLFIRQQKHSRQLR